VFISLLLQGLSCKSSDQETKKTGIGKGLKDLIDKVFNCTTDFQMMNQSNEARALYSANDVGKKVIAYHRIYQDTILLVHICYINGMRELVVKSLSPVLLNYKIPPLKDLLQNNTTIADIEAVKAVIFAASHDRELVLLDKNKFLKKVAEGLGKQVEVVPHFYTVMRGDRHQHKNHLEVSIDQKGAHWSSAIDDYGEKHNF
tara:strand:+ start:3435 stop:4037 length:603 start_codon:yes stop_codon:yes gene_type:complete